MALGKLSRFEKLFADTIIERGRDYENMGSVTQLAKQSLTTHSTKTKQYMAQVIGSRPYQVKLLLTDLPDNDMTIESMTCQCPYEDNCKHMVAMLFKIRNLQAQGQLSALNTTVDNDNNHTNIDDAESVESLQVTESIIDNDKILQSLDDTALRQFVQHCLLRHPNLTDELVIWHNQYQLQTQIHNNAESIKSGASDPSEQQPVANNVSYDCDRNVLASLYRQIGMILDLEEHQLYGYEPDVSDNLYQFEVLFSQFNTQPHYQLHLAIRWIGTLIQLFDEHPESDLDDLAHKGFIALGEVLFNVKENEKSSGYLPHWSQDFKPYHTNLPDDLISLVRENVEHWQYDGDIQYMTDDCEMGRLYFDLYIARQDWLGAINVLNQNIAQAKVNKYDEYDLQSLIALKIALLNHIHTTPKLAVYAKAVESVAQLMQDYEHLPQVRRIMVNNAMQNNKLDDAIALIKAGIVSAKEQGHHGTVNEWRAQLIDVAKNALQDKTLQTVKYHKDVLLQMLRDNSKALAIDGKWFDEDYYKEWRDSYPCDEWQKIINAQLTELQSALERSLQHSLQQGHANSHPNNSRFNRGFDRGILSLLMQLYALEKQDKELVALLKTYPDIYYVEQYQNKLIASDADWLIDYYKQYWQQRIEQVSNRSHYNELAQDIQRMLKVLPQGKKVWQPMVNAWQARFSTKPRKPALLDELSKIEWGD